MRSFVVLTITAALVACAVPQVRADWIVDGNPVCTVGGMQWYPRITPDGSQGAVILWTDGRNGVSDVYAQRIDVGGNVLWTNNGVAGTVGAQAVPVPAIASDGSGGAIFAWVDGRGVDEDVYVQRIDSAGTVVWNASGVNICSASGDQQETQIIADGAGGAFVVWQDYRNPGGGIYAQRVDASGNAMWTPNGVAVCSTSASHYYPNIASDGAGGAIVIWSDDRSGDKDIYAQRIDSNGSVLWAEDGVAVCTAPGDQENPHPRWTVMPDGAGGAVMVWHDARSGAGSRDIYAQRIDAWGAVQWTTNGVAVCAASGDQQTPDMVADETGGYIVAWHDERSVGSGVDVYAQKINSAGKVEWTTDGVAICTEYEGQTSPRVVADGTGGAIITWRDQRYYNDVYAQATNTNGQTLWQHQGIPVCEAIGTQAAPVITSDGEGGALIAWMDYRSSVDYDIYATRVSAATAPDGAPVIVAVQDVPNDQGGKIGILWDKSPLDMYPTTDIDHYSVWRRLTTIHGVLLVDSADGGSATTVAESGKRRDTIYRSGYAWEWLSDVPAAYFDTYAYTATSLYDSTALDTGWQYFMVRAQTDIPYVFYDSEVDSGYSVDNLPPGVPQGFAVAYNTGSGNQLTWIPSPESDFQYYGIYRGDYADFVPGSGTLVHETAVEGWTDPDYDGWNVFYKITALDNAGNESEPTSTGTKTGIDEPRIPNTFALYQNVPNPFNPSTRIRYDVPEGGGDVTLRVYDVAGRRIRTLVDGYQTAGEKHVAWYGRNDTGHRVATGVYFCRMTAPGFTNTRKMVLTQ